MSNGLCVVGRDDRMGLGSMTADFCVGMKPDRLVLVQGDRRAKMAEPLSANEVLKLQWRDLRAGRHDSDVLKGMRTVVSFETWYSDSLPAVSRSLGVKSVIFPMWEWSSVNHARNTDVLVALSGTDYEWCLNLPQAQSPCRLYRHDWPASPEVKAVCKKCCGRGIYTQHNQDGSWEKVGCEDCKGSGILRSLNWPPRTFVHVAGNANHNREGTREVLMAAHHLRGTGAKLVCYSSFNAAIHFNKCDPGHDVLFKMPTVSRRELFDGCDCLVQPRRLGGHSLPINEAQGEGIPVITLDLPDWRTNPYRVPAIPQPAERFGPGLCSVSTCDPDELGRRMREMAEGRAVRVEGPKLPTWSEFKEWWTKEVDCA